MAEEYTYTRQELESKNVDELIALKKKLYSNVDIESPKSEQEKLLERVLNEKFSESQARIIEKRKTADAEKEDMFSNLGYEFKSLGRNQYGLFTMDGVRVNRGLVARKPDQEKFLEDWLKKEKDVLSMQNRYTKKDIRQALIFLYELDKKSQELMDTYGGMRNIPSDVKESFIKEYYDKRDEEIDVKTAALYGIEVDVKNSEGKVLLYDGLKSEYEYELSTQRFGDSNRVDKKILSDGKNRISIDAVNPSISYNGVFYRNRSKGEINSVDIKDAAKEFYLLNKYWNDFPNHGETEKEMEINITAKNLVDLLKESSKLGARKVKVVFERLTKEDFPESTLETPAVKSSIGTQKEEVFDIETESSDILNLLNNKKGIESMTYIVESFNPEDELSGFRDLAKRASAKYPEISKASVYFIQEASKLKVGNRAANYFSETYGKDKSGKLLSKEKAAENFILDSIGEGGGKIEPFKEIDINGVEIKVGDTVKTQQEGGGILQDGPPSIGIAEKTKDAFGNEAFQIRFRKPNAKQDTLILLTGKINEVIEPAITTGERKEKMKQKQTTETDTIGEGKLYEFFTPEYICRKMWDLAYLYGFKRDDKVLEPSVGSGNMIEHAPDKSKVTVFEIKKEYLDMCLSRFPSVVHYNQSFETCFLAPPRYNSVYKGGASWLPSDFGLVISNPPYGKVTGYYKNILKLSGQFEHWFMLNTLKLLKSGGIGIYLVPSGFMRNGNTYSGVKESIFKMAKLVDVYRLPNKLFASTSIGTDIIVLRKK